MKDLRTVILKDPRIKHMDVNSKGAYSDDGDPVFRITINPSERPGSLSTAAPAVPWHDSLIIVIRSTANPPLITVTLLTEIKNKDGKRLLPNGMIEMKMNSEYDTHDQFPGEAGPPPLPVHKSTEEYEQIQDDIGKWINIYLQELSYLGYSDSEGHITRQESKLPRFKDYFISEIDKLGVATHTTQSGGSAPMMASITPPSDGVKKLYKKRRARERRKEKRESR